MAYKLVPRDVVPVMVQEGSYIYDRARFVQHNLWVTKYDPAEKFAAGDYMYQSADAQGLPEFIDDDAPLENTDVVLWYTLGAHHVVRPEDWPVMPCAYTGFHLKPLGFFDGNPALDLPPSPPEGLPLPSHLGAGDAASRPTVAEESFELPPLLVAQFRHQTPFGALTPASVRCSSSLPSRVSSAGNDRPEATLAGPADEAAFLAGRAAPCSSPAARHWCRAPARRWTGPGMRDSIRMQMYCGKVSPSGSSTLVDHVGAQCGGHPVQQIAQRLVVQRLLHVNDIDIYQLD